MAVQEYTTISDLVKNNSKYNFAAVEALYKIIESTSEGSPEAREIYEKMVGISQRTEDLDYREKINNISDKALVYTRRRTED